MIPLHVDDGDFSLAMQVGNWSYSYPFADKGDMTSFVASRKMRQMEPFTPPIAMSARTFANQKSALYTSDTDGNLIAGPLSAPATAYLVSIGDAADIDQGLLEWDEKWASVPNPRTEYGSTSCTQIVALNSGESDFTYGAVAYGQINAIFDAKYLFEYSLNEPLPTIHQPRFVNVSGDHSFAFGSIRDILAQRGYILAQDSTSSVYMGRIYQRQSCFALRARPRQIT